MTTPLLSLGRIPSSILGLLYILLVPFFAAVFTSFAGEFYHTSVEHEPYLKSDELRLLDDLRDSAISSFVDAHGARFLAEQSLLNWDYIYFYDLQYSSGVFSFGLMASPAGRANRIPPGLFRLQFSLDWPRPAKDGEGERMYGMGSVHRGDKIRLASLLFPVNRRFSDEVQSSDQGFIVLSESLEGRLEDWAKAMEGFPARSSGTYWRMLYLSAITITTVGYGDILPVTTRARLWVATEAILGVVVAGLFLNSLAERVRRVRADG